MSLRDGYATEDSFRRDKERAREIVARRSYGTSSFRVCNVGYLNSAPFREIAKESWIEYEEREPSECARLLHENEVDLAFVPLASFAVHGGYQALPFGIAADGPVDSVFLLAERPLEELSTILLDSGSQTSIILFRLLLQYLAPEKAPSLLLTRISAESASTQIGGDVGAVLIGSQGFAHRGKYPVQLDLAALWKEKTGLPFVFAVWAGRALTTKEYASLEASFEAGIEQQELYARDWAEQHGIDRDASVRYVRDRIIYTLDERAIAGAEEFLRQAASLKLLPETELRFFKSPPGASQLRARELAPSSVEKSQAPILSNGPYGIDRLLHRAAGGERLSIAEGMRLCTEASLADLSLAADERRVAMHSSNSVSYIIDRNINYTNICNVYCRFCAFYRAPGKEGGYLLSKEELGAKIQETVDAGGIQILLQGGLHPELGIEYYEDLFRWIKMHYPVNLHALSSDEIWHIARVSDLSTEEVVARLIDAGLGSLPGGGGEILVDRVRQRIARLKTTTEEWLDVHRVAHRLGLTSTCTMMFGVQETWEDRIVHFEKLRALQDETGGFTAFIAWPFQEDPEYTRLKRGRYLGA